jgi:hypothetical protein
MPIFRAATEEQDIDPGPVTTQDFASLTVVDSVHHTAASATKKTREVETSWDVAIHHHY